MLRPISVVSVVPEEATSSRTTQTKKSTRITFKTSKSWKIERDKPHDVRRTIADEDQTHHDFVLVTPTVSSQYRQELHTALQDAGFELDTFDSLVLKGDEAVQLCCFALPADRCREFAAAIRAPARLDPLTLKKECEALNPPITFRQRAVDGASLQEISDRFNYYPPFLHIFCPLRLEKARLFLPFIAHNRAKLQLRMLAAPRMERSAPHSAARGAGMNLHEMQRCHPFTRYKDQAGDGGPRVATLMLLHESLADTSSTRHKLWREWVRGPCSANLPWNVPVHRIREYFGDATGFYFLFMSTFTTHCLPMGIVGALIMVVHSIFWSMDGFPDQIRHLPSCIFALLNVLVLMGCLLHYRRKQAMCAKEWGCYAWTRGTVHVRTAFKGVPQVDPVDGHITVDWPEYLRRRRQTFSWVVIICLMCGISGVVVAIFRFRAWCWNQPEDSLWRTYGVGLAVALNVLQVLCFNQAYYYVAKLLTAQENWKTDAQYSDNLVMKLFLAQFFNTFISIYYVAFVKIMPGVEPCRFGSCFYELFFSVAPIYISNAASSFAQQALLPWLQQRRIRSRTGCDYGSDKEKRTMARRQFIELTDFDNIEGPIEDFMEAALQFSFLACFGAAFPLSPLVCFLLNVLQIKQDAYKMLWLHRRPLAVEMQGIGIWVSIYFTIINIAIPTNVGIIVFTSGILGQVDAYIKTFIFVVGSMGLFGITRAMMAIFPAESDAVKLQLKRQEVYSARVVQGLSTGEDVFDKADAEECDTELVWADHVSYM
eukprot:TRINITY_DN30905_c0_g1_i1.p1 TRINITY_DN30905_c0_g1~~TRINITY_DN30905_c0_g1_i1.p1  ORF type:complete len:767 (-),score=99.31 TRINITY_DN30905_c0_g1_i1:150-2450(-)